MQVVTKEQQPRWNAIIVDVLRAFDQICRKNGLTYFCGGGTAIGAVRHHGIIPWDDDIDLFMPRPDYDRFLSLTAEMDLGDYEVLTPWNTLNYPFHFSKMCNRHTTLVEEADTPCVTGLFIDIFPLDGTASDLDEAIRLKRRFRKISNRLEAISTHNTFLEYLSLLKNRKEWGRFATKTLGFFFRSSLRKYLLGQMERICRKYDYQSAENVVVYCGVYDEREIYPKAWVSGQVEMEFEGLMVPLSVGYDQYLRQFFGDYMQLPPEEKRVSHHVKAFFDLDHRWDYKEVMSLMKKNKA